MTFFDEPATITMHGADNYESGLLERSCLHDVAVNVHRHNAWPDWRITSGYSDLDPSSILHLLSALVPSLSFLVTISSTCQTTGILMRLSCLISKIMVC